MLTMNCFPSCFLLLIIEYYFCCVSILPAFNLNLIAVEFIYFKRSICGYILATTKIEWQNSVVTAIKISPNQ